MGLKFLYLTALAAARRRVSPNLQEKHISELNQLIKDYDKGIGDTLDHFDNSLEVIQRKNVALIASRRLLGLMLAQKDGFDNVFLCDKVIRLIDMALSHTKNAIRID